MQEFSTAQISDREYRTLAHLQQFAAFLGGFPRRKNLAWFSGSFPLSLFGPTTTRFESDVKKTVNLLTTARVAMYPVDASGLSELRSFTAAGTNPSPGSQLPKEMSGAVSNIGTKPNDHADSTLMGGRSSDPLADGPLGPSGLIDHPLTVEGSTRASGQSTMDMLAHDSGGEAYFNTNGLPEVVAKIVSSSVDFYTLSYTPAYVKMDGNYLRIEVKVSGGKSMLSYRRGYYARDEDLPGAAQFAKGQSSQSKAVVDPLRPFMELGMPQTEQILYKAIFQQLPAKQSVMAGTDQPAVVKGDSVRYSVDSAIDLKDLNLKQDTEGLHKGTLVLSLIVYDRYGQIVSRKDHRVALSVKPDVSAVYQQNGVQLHAELDVPKGQNWLRTGFYKEASRKVGTMEVPLSSVKVGDTAAK
jgi:VWFA-related protein